MQALVMLAMLLGYYEFVRTYAAGIDTIEQTNAVAPCLFVLIMSFTAYRCIRARETTIWSPVFLFPVQSAVFFGLGPLVEVFGNPVTIDFLNRGAIDMRPDELLRSHVLSTLGIFFVMLGMWVHMLLFPNRWRRSANVGRQSSPIAKRVPFDPAYVALALILFGGTFRHLVIMPAQWGMIDLTVAGVLTALGSIVDVGFGLLAILIARGRKSLLIVFVVLWPAHVFLTVLSFAKSAIIIALLFPVIGFFAGNRNIKRLAVRLALVAIVFAVSQDWVHHGRAIVLERTQTINEADYSERLEILFDYAVNRRAYEQEGDARQGWWTRLNFSRVQAFAMTAYDTGRPCNSLSTAWMHFIPRAIWTEKPILYGPGLAFYETVTGNSLKSFLGLSIYGDLYWQFGWTGLALGCFAIGLLFSMLAWRSLSIMETDDFMRVPLVLIAFEIAALSPNKFVVNGLVGPMPIYIAYSVGIAFAYLIYASSSKRGGILLPGAKQTKS